MLADLPKGSFASFPAYLADVRLSLKSDTKPDIAECPLCADFVAEVI